MHPWLMPRPAHMGGHWRLGCDVCFWKKHNATKAVRAKAGRRGNDDRNSTFANYNFVGDTHQFLLATRLRQHAVHAGHKIAVAASRSAAKGLPPRLVAEAKKVGGKRLKVSSASADGESQGGEVAEPVLVDNAGEVIARARSSVLAEASLLKGRVPQISDWLDCWAESTDVLAFRKQIRIWGKKNRNRSAGNWRQTRRKMVGIMAAVRREEIREQLRKATFISIAMDERQYQKILRYRCDAPTEPFMHSGILGVVSLEKDSLSEFNGDHALAAVRKLDRWLNAFCTPLSSKRRPLAVDFELKEHIRKNTRTFAVDGASKERRALLYAAENLFPNMVLLLRDAAHALRITIKEPIHNDEVFGDVWHQLFDKRHALVPDVMNSKKWQDLLQHIQREVLRIPGVRQPLAVVLKHLRFAKQRFDSAADPVAKVAFMLFPPGYVACLYRV